MKYLKSRNEKQKFRKCRTWMEQNVVHKDDLHRSGYEFHNIMVLKQGYSLFWEYQYQYFIFHRVKYIEIEKPGIFIIDDITSLSLQKCVSLQLWRFFFSKKWCFLLFECSRGGVFVSSKWRSNSSRSYSHDVDDVISNLYVDLFFEKYSLHKKTKEYQY
jgi:hypothetical protein